MTTIELEASKLELIKEIINIDSSKTIEKIRATIKRITPKHVVEEDETLLTEEDFFAKVDRAKQSIERGEGKVFKTKEELHAYFKSV